MRQSLYKEHKIEDLGALMAKERLLTQAGYQTLRRPVKDYFTDLKTYIFFGGGAGAPYTLYKH